MLKALLANNDEHYDSGERADPAYSGSNGLGDNSVANGRTGSFRIEDDRNSDYGSKQGRLQRCTEATPDSSQFNLVCQGPKVKYDNNEFAVGDQFSHYRHWSLEKGGEYPRLPNQVNGQCSTAGSCDTFVGQIMVDDAEWVSGRATDTVRPYSKVAKEGFAGDCALESNSDNCKNAFDAADTVRAAHHRVDGSYTPWGFDCDFSDRPCTHEFISNHYGFLRAINTPNMERAPCHAEVCGATVFPESYAHVDSSLCSECSTGSSLEHRTGDCACLAAHAGAQAEDCTAAATSCACLASRDAAFCDTCEAKGTCGDCNSDTESFCQAPQ